MILAALAFACAGPASAVATWTSPNHFRVMLSVNARGVTRRNSPASVYINLQSALTSMGGTGTIDMDTVEVVAYDTSGVPNVFDSSRAGYEKYLLPFRVERYYPINPLTLSFVMPDDTYTQYAVYFDTVESGLGKPTRYPGLVGNGDKFREEYKRREINASHFDHFVDFDGDGDLDLFKAGVEPWVYCYENVGGNRMIDRGRLTSGGSLFALPASVGDNRSWMSVAFHDWDGDGDLDFLPSFTSGNDAGTIVYYRNTTTPGGTLTFTRVGALQTISGTLVAGGITAGGWFPSIACVGDWDGDRHAGTDILVGSNNRCWLYRSQGRDGSGAPRLADAVAIQAAGTYIVRTNPRYDVADIDNDGDLDLFAGCQEGPIYWYRNIGTRTAPVFAAGVVVAYSTPYYIGDAHSSMKIADWDGDGLLDIVAGRYWERTPSSEATLPRYYGGFYKNVGTPTNPVFQRSDEYHGAPYTERFQQCDAVRQNGVRMSDWNNDGKPDLIAGDTDGFVWYFRNLTGKFFPVFDTGVKLYAGGQPISLMGSGGHARPDIVYWDNDTKKDLIVSDGNGTVTLFLNTGTDANPSFTTGTRLSAGGSYIDTPGSRSSVLVCDWNNDGKKDIVMGDDNTSAGGYYKFINTGTITSPFLTAGVPITFGGQTVTYTRPNVGSYVDWDGDTKKDFIACNFENNIRFYKNIGTNTSPAFANNEGVLILKDYSIMMISGADVKDWNSDNDLDILTGQGHGGSGLRFYERDYIKDYGTGLYPTVSLSSYEFGRTVSGVKSLANGLSVVMPVVTVSACFNGFFYVQSADRVGGMRVELAGHGRIEGERIDIRGVIWTNAAGERYVQPTSITPNP